MIHNLSHITLENTDTGYLTEEDFANAEKDEYLKEPIGDENMDPALFEGDMAVDEFSSKVAQDYRKWPKTGSHVIIPIEMKSGLTKEIKAEIARALKEFQNHTCIR